jgi:hypothetical protein
MSYVSPIHIRFYPFTKDDLENNLDGVIDVFQARIDGWYLEIADRCINGWQENGVPCINTIDRQGRSANYIPDSAFAVLMIVFNYFEVIGVFKKGITSKNQSFEKFTAGIDDIFPELSEPMRRNLRRRMYRLRKELYHVQRRDAVYTLLHIDDTSDITINEKDILVIDPHNLIPRLRSHFREYCAQLKDVDQVELRQTFRKAFAYVYGIKDGQQP